MAEYLEVREVGLRDGIQSIKTVVPTDLKLAWIKAEAAAGVRDIEVCSFVPPKLLPQFAYAEEVTKQALQIPGLTVAACVDADPAAARAMAEQLGAAAHSGDFALAVDTPADYAVLSTPNFLHVGQASALLRSSKHVLLQKPMARHLAEARDLFALQRAGDKDDLPLFRRTAMPELEPDAALPPMPPGETLITAPGLPFQTLCP